MAFDIADSQLRALAPPQNSEWQASFHGISIHTDPSLPHGHVEFRDRAGKALGTIIDVGGISIGTNRS